MIKRMLRFAGTMVVCAGLAVGSVQAADVWGLVIGIDDYQHIPKLRGAVNDARDIEDALRTLGAGEIKVLLDQAANRDAVISTWRDLAQRAQPGDTLVVSYAGHGGQEPERVPGSETDGQDEVLLLAGFDPYGQATYERIPDDDLNELLRASSHLNVLFISDACHSGTMTRAFDPRAGIPSVRFYDYGSISGDALPPPDPYAASTRDTELSHVTYFAGVTDDKTVPEVSIDGQQRGAMSWSVAQAFRGAGDLDRDGTVSVGELQTFVMENVRMKTNGRQQPVVTAPKPAKTALVSLPGGASAPPPASGPTLTPLPMIRLHLANTGVLDPNEAAARLRRAQLVGSANGAEVVWDVQRGDLVLDTGDLVQTRAFKRARTARPTAVADDFDFVSLQNAIDKWSLNKALVEASASRSLQMQMIPDERRYRAGDTPTFSVAGHEYPYFTLINLGTDGSIHFLYPLAEYGDPLTIPVGQAFELPLEVSPPYGADHFIAIASETPLSSLHTALGRLEGVPAAEQLANLLTTHLSGQRYQLGVHAVFTGE